MTESPNQRLYRARPVLALATVAFAIGAIVGARHATPAANTLADQFVSAWTRGNYVSMYSDISEAAQHSMSVTEFASLYKEDMRTATATGAKVDGKTQGLTNGNVTVPVRVSTRLFGKLSLHYTLHTVQEPSGGTRIAWSHSLVFPGLQPGELLSRHTSLPRRATLLARDGTVLAESPPGADPIAAGEANRNSPLGTVADAVVGTVGPPAISRRQTLEEQGVPPEASVGVSGLELAYDERLRGIPGGELLAGAHLLAYAAPHAAPPLRTSVSPAVQQAAVTALGNQLGGVIAMQPSGQILAVAGIGLDGLQPPGSTFKMITTTGVLNAKLASPHTVFPYATFATLDGVKLNNANGEECGGTLELSFAVSCNSVFSPLGVKLGATRLVATAERFGFNHQPSISGAAESTLPAAHELQGELDVGSTAIGQGQVLATPLQMGTVAATIGDGGQRPTPSFLVGKTAAGVPVMSQSVAHTMRRLMIAVVREGTGTAAAIPGVTVAGKTGTAELKTACPTPSESSSSETGSATTATAEKEGCQGSEDEAANTDAWFAAFAPALDPRIVVCVMLVKDGAGGATAAPVAREVIEAALHAEH